MKRFLLSLFVLLVTAMSLSAQSDSLLTVKVLGIGSSSGHVLLALYDNAEDWTKPEVAKYVRKAPASKGAMLIEFAHLAPGEYAIAALHDTDDSGDMTFSSFGFPKEAYGFSNDARGMLSAPGYEECTFTFGRSGMLTLTLK